MMSAAVRSTRIVCFYSSSILLLGSLLMLQPHRSDGKSVPGFAGSGAMVGNEAAASVPSSSKLWPKATLQQALRQIRGFRPQSLSTARGFGKRFDAQYMPFNPTSGVLSTAGTSSPSSSSASSSLSSLPTSSSSFAPSASFDLSSYLLRPTYPLIDNRAEYV